MDSVYYTAHYNWAWVVTAALDELKQKLPLKEATLCERFRDLPSNQQSAVKTKATYSLFRLDWKDHITNEIHMVRTRSDIFGFLDPKDSLARICQLLSASQFMPDTLLIPYNWVAASDRSESYEDTVHSEIARRLSAGPKLLKAPLGSGGFGLYFVYSVHDVEEIIFHHRRIAEEKEGFMQDLSSTFYGVDSGNVLCWSLQDVISGVRVLSDCAATEHGVALPAPVPVPTAAATGTAATVETSATTVHPPVPPLMAPSSARRCQVRAYIVLVNDALYLYNTYEVRLPSWDIDLDAQLSAEHALYNNTTSTAAVDAVHAHAPAWSNELENIYCGTGHGRPYNEKRNKHDTERHLLSELYELRGSEAAVTTCMQGLFAALKPVLLSRQRRSALDSASDKTGSRAEMSHIFDANAIQRAVNDAQSCNTATPAVTHNVLTEVAIVGVDLVLTENKTDAGDGAFAAHVVEINNNPAMPASEGKHMSVQYRAHMVDFVGAVLQLALRQGGAPVDAQSEDTVEGGSSSRRRCLDELFTAI